MCDAQFNRERHCDTQKLAPEMFTKIIFTSVLAGLFSLFIAEHEVWLKYLNAVIFPNASKATRIFHKDELKQYNGVESPDIYLVILGKVYNVTKGKKHYGPNEAYHIFVGNLKPPITTCILLIKHCYQYLRSRCLKELCHW